MFTIDTFENRLQKYLQATFNVKTIIERSTITDKVKGEKPRIVIKITGQMKDVESALDGLLALFSALRTRKFDEKTGKRQLSSQKNFDSKFSSDGNWTKIDEAIEIIQYHFSLNDLICSCQKTSPTSVHINYFAITNPQFGIDEQKIEEIINNQFSSATLTFNQQSISPKFLKEWTDLEDSIRNRDDYKKDICLSKETNTIYLFGLTKLVKEFRQKFEEIKTKHIPQICKIKFSEKQVKVFYEEI